MTVDQSIPGTGAKGINVDIGAWASRPNDNPSKVLRIFDIKKTIFDLLQIPIWSRYRQTKTAWIYNIHDYSSCF